jgi:hypothetical protein
VKQNDMAIGISSGMPNTCPIACPIHVKQQKQISGMSIIKSDDAKRQNCVSRGGQMNQEVKSLALTQIKLKLLLKKVESTYNFLYCQRIIHKSV